MVLHAWPAWVGRDGLVKTPMEEFVGMYLFTEMFTVTGGSILLDGGQSVTPAKLVIEDCEIRDARSSVSGGRGLHSSTFRLNLSCFGV